MPKCATRFCQAFEFITRNFKPILSPSYYHQCANRILKMKGILVYLSVLLSWSYWICNILHGYTYTIHNKKWTYSIAKEIMSFEFKYYVEEFQNSSMRGWDNFHDGFQFGRKLFWSKYKQSYYYDYFFCWIVSKPFNYIMHYRPIGPFVIPTWCINVNQ